eukprot:GEMP01014598.1.p1 GENE.GEMP01014598.1~~GEMP01014598.1.p1  ORF type:complete len:825 (+),score=81.19 GEMP01014598.1:59-2476(+)
MNLIRQFVLSIFGAQQNVSSTCASVSVCATAGWVKDALKDMIPCNGDACDGDKCCKLNDATPATSPTTRTTGTSIINVSHDLWNRLVYLTDPDTTAEAAYTKVQFVGLQVDISSDNYQVINDSSATSDIEGKVDIIKKFVDISHAKSSIDHNSDTLKILVLPDFFFQSSVQRYTLSDFKGNANNNSSGIVHKLATIVNHEKYAHWLFVFGSIPCSSPTSDHTAASDMCSVTIIQLGHSDPHDPTRRQLMIEKSVCHVDPLLNHLGISQGIAIDVEYVKRVEESMEMLIPTNAMAFRRAPVQHDSLFVFHGITFGLETRVDHMGHRLQTAVQGSTANLMQIQIVTSSGGLVSHDSICVESEGLVFINNREFSSGLRSARSIIAIVETDTRPFDDDADWKDAGRSDVHTENLHDWNGMGIIIYEPQLIPPKKSSEGSSKCMYEEFSCDNKKTCILLARVCDNRHDCSDGSDERNCLTVRRERTRAKCVMQSSKVDVCHGCRIDCAVIGIKCTFRNRDGLSVEGKVRSRRRDPWKRNICRIPKSGRRSFRYGYTVGNCHCPDDCSPAILPRGVALSRRFLPYLHREGFRVILTCAPGNALKGSTNPHAKVCNSADTAFTVVDGDECAAYCEQAILPAGVVVSNTSLPVLFQKDFHVPLECAVGYSLKGLTNPRATVCNSPGEVYIVDHEDECVMVNPAPCLCANGIPHPGHCTTAGVTKCSTCDSGYSLYGDICADCLTACTTSGATCQAVLLEGNRLKFFNHGKVFLFDRIYYVCMLSYGRYVEYFRYNVVGCSCFLGISLQNTNIF